MGKKLNETEDLGNKDDAASNNQQTVPGFTKLSLTEITKIIRSNNNSVFSTELIVALSWTESSFISEAKSPSSTATGLMMMTKPAIDTVNKNTPSNVHFEHDEMTNPDKAIAAGTWYLRIIYDRHGGKDKKKTLKAYGTGTDVYADNIITAEACLLRTPGNQQCLNVIHPLNNMEVEV